MRMLLKCAISKIYYTSRPALLPRHRQFHYHVPVLPSYSLSRRPRSLNLHFSIADLYTLLPPLLRAIYIAPSPLFITTRDDYDEVKWARRCCCHFALLLCCWMAMRLILTLSPCLLPVLSSAYTPSFKKIFRRILPARSARRRLTGQDE